MNKQQYQKNIFQLVMSAPAIFYISLFLIYPIILVIYQSFWKMGLTTNGGEFVGFNNYQKILKYSKFQATISNTLLFTFVAVFFEFILGMLLALLIHSLTKGKQFIRTLFLLPLMLAPVIAGISWRFILSSEFGLLNWVLYGLGIIAEPAALAWLKPQNILFSAIIADIWLTTPYMMLFFLAGLQSIPQDQIESAKIDGATALQRFKYIALPWISPVIIVAIIMRLIDAARTFDMIWIVTGGKPGKEAAVFSTLIYETLMINKKNGIGYASAMATLFMIALLAIALAFYFLSLRRQHKG